MMYEEGDIVQLDPHVCKNSMFAGCFMVITEVKSWGAQGYVQSLGKNGEPGGQAYYRATSSEMSKALGKAQWVV